MPVKCYIQPLSVSRLTFRLLSCGMSRESLLFKRLQGSSHFMKQQKGGSQLQGMPIGIEKARQDPSPKKFLESQLKVFPDRGFLQCSIRLATTVELACSLARFQACDLTTHFPLTFVYSMADVDCFSRAWTPWLPWGW